MKGHDYWRIVNEQIRCQCGAVFSGLIAWAEHSRTPNNEDA